MKSIVLLILGIIMTFGISMGQSTNFDCMNFLLGDYNGKGN
jgi:hypothetical protein